MSLPVQSLIASPRHVGTEGEWWRRAVVYQVYPRSFQDTNGDGYGDIPGITSRLDHLDALGVDVVWLSPVYRSPQDDNGYDISDYRDIDPMFGTLEDLDTLVTGLHQRGMRLVMDLVVNHTSDDHEWFRDSRSSRTSSRRDWYIWRPARQVEGLEPGQPGTEPTNWGSAFSGSAWAWDEASGEFYLHLFSPRQPDLNWENPEVRRAVYDMMTWWLDRGVDGFRMDVINLISKTYPLADGPRGEGDLYGSAFAAVANGPRIHEFLAEMNREVLAPRPGHVITVGEMPGVTREQARLYTGPQRGELDMVFQFEHMSLAEGPGGKFDPVPVDLVELKHNLAAWQEGLAPERRAGAEDGGTPARTDEGGGTGSQPHVAARGPEGGRSAEATSTRVGAAAPAPASLAETGWNSLYWDNHDQPRAVSRFGDDDPAWREVSAKTLASVLHAHRGTPYVYQGEELGMVNTVLERIEDYRDLESVNYFHERVSVGDDPAVLLRGMSASSRDNARTPVQWSDAENAGFTTGQPWMPVAPGLREVNAAAQVGVAGSVFEHYRALIALRHDDDVLALGTFRLLAADHPSAWVVLRELETQAGREQILLIAQCAREELVLGPCEHAVDPGGEAAPGERRQVECPGEERDASLRGEPVPGGTGGLWEALGAEGLDAGEWAGAQRLLHAADPGVHPSSGHVGAPHSLGGWDSVLLRLRA